jgi:glycosyltransferase involved in cell wall biosynthesis
MGGRQATHRPNVFLTQAAAEGEDLRRMFPKLLLATTVPITLRSFLIPLARRFRDRGWRVDAMAEGVSACHDCREAFDRVRDVSWSRNPFDLQSMARSAGQVREIALREGYDLVHVHTPVAAFVARHALRRARHNGRPRIIYTAHGFHFHRGGSLFRNLLFRELERLAGRWTDYLVVINREDEEAAREYRIVPPGRIRPIPGIGVDTDFYAPRPELDIEACRLRTELGLGPGDPLFLMVAEFTRNKRHRDVLEAFARLARPGVRLAFAGDGPQRADMERQAAELGIAGRVFFLGFRGDVAALMRAARATVLPSSREGLPRTVMESLSLEVPVIGTRIRGIRDLVEGGAGILVPVGDVDGLARAMAWVLDHPEEARAMGRRGRVRMAGYDLRRILDMHETLYEEALGEAHAQAVV